MSTNISEEDMLACRDYRLALEKALVKDLGDKIGYGNLMQLCEIAWREKLIAEGMKPGGEFAYGPCAAFMVTCEHAIKDENGHCELCCGAGRISKGVKQLVDRMPL